MTISVVPLDWDGRRNISFVLEIALGQILHQTLRRHRPITMTLWDMSKLPPKYASMLMQNKCQQVGMMCCISNSHCTVCIKGMSRYSCNRVFVEDADDVGWVIDDDGVSIFPSFQVSRTRRRSTFSSLDREIVISLLTLTHFTLQAPHFLHYVFSLFTFTHFSQGVQKKKTIKKCNSNKFCP